MKDIYKNVDNNIKQRLTAPYFLSLDSEELKKWTYYACSKAQLEGLLAGHNKKAITKISLEDLYIINSVGNLEELKMLIDVREYEFADGDHRFYNKENMKNVKENITEDL